MGGRTGACVLQWSWELRRWVQVAAAHRCTAGRAAARRNLERSMGGETTEETETARRHGGDRQTANSARFHHSARPYNHVGCKWELFIPLSNCGGGELVPILVRPSEDRRVCHK